MIKKNRSQAKQKGGHMESISDKIGRFYSRINAYEPEKIIARYQAWEWCYLRFRSISEVYEQYEEDEQRKFLDELTLQLGFFMANCEMRRTSFTVMRDSGDTLRFIVRVLLRTAYDPLRKLDPRDAAQVAYAKDCIFKKDGLYDIIRETGFDDTVITRSLFGTFGCMPAFDRYMKAGLNWYRKNGSVPEGVRLTQKVSEENYLALCRIAAANYDELMSLDLQCGKQSFPIMKLLDLYFWEIGYELDLVSRIEKAASPEKKAALLKVARGLGLYDETNAAAPLTQIKAKNPQKEK